LRVWPAVALLALFWAVWLWVRWVELPMFTRFLSSVVACAVLTALFTAWWWLNGGFRPAERLLGFVVALAGGVIAAVLSPTRVGMIAWLLMTVPVVLTAWTAWLVAARRAAPRVRLVGLLVVVLLTWQAFTLVRMEGLTGDGESVLRWRWSSTAEEVYLAERARGGGTLDAVGPTDLEQTGTSLQAGDWPGFRGPNRDGVVRQERIATDWSSAPPPLLWRRRIGPGWSSVAVVGGRVLTQEQRGESEVVVCLDAATGREVWGHQDAVRFQDAQAGPGPRATPTFAGGFVYALGATGLLNCLDAASGERKWSRDIAADSGARPPLWGFSSSPLVVGGVVIVFAGGKGPKTLLAYHVESGEPAWTADVAKASYSSPHQAALGGEEQVLFLGDRGLVALAPASGSVLWEHAAPGSGMPRSLQPHPLGKGQFLIASEADFGTALLDVKRDGRSWSATERWTSRELKPSFNDFVVQDGFIYGFDKNVFCCVDVATGERRWKQGRYGHGQVLLLAEQKLLLVVSERGEAILVRADAVRHEELGRFQALQGKTWNHPAIARGRLYVRNGEEIACYDVGLTSTH
jgi:outer membrane protein assembly factor BamB